MGTPYHLLLLLLLLPFANSDQHICGDPADSKKIVSNAKTVIKNLVHLTSTAGSHPYNYVGVVGAVRGIGWCSPDISALICELCIAMQGNVILKSCKNSLYAIAWSGESCYLEFKSAWKGSA